MGIQSKAAKPAGITNSSGQPEIVLEIDGLTITMAPPSTTTAPATTEPDTADDTADEAR